MVEGETKGYNKFTFMIKNTIAEICYICDNFLLTSYHVRIEKIDINRNRKKWHTWSKFAHIDCFKQIQGTLLNNNINTDEEIIYCDYCNKDTEGVDILFYIDFHLETNEDDSQYCPNYVYHDECFKLMVDEKTLDEP